jgi:hypothetical protein
MRRCPLLLLPLLLSLFAPGCLTAQSQWTRHCSQPDPRIGLSPGDWKGTFSIDMGAQGAAKHLGIALQFKLTGTLTVQVAWNETVRKVRGHLEYTFGGSGHPAAALEVGSAMKGASDDLQVMMDGATYPRSSGFTVKVFGQEAGKLYTISPAGTHETPKSGGGSMLLRFRVTSADCTSALGSVDADLVDQTAQSLAGGGYQVSGPTGSWHLKNEEDFTKKAEELKERLARASDGELAAVGARLAQIADQVKAESPALAPCLMDIWFDYAGRIRAQWINRVTEELQAFTGDYLAFAPLVKRALDYDRQLALLGMDECSRPFHEKLFAALERAHMALLERMIQQQAQPIDVLAAMRAGELLGTVGPELNARAMANVRDHVGQMVARIDKDFRASMQGAQEGNTLPCEILIPLARRLWSVAREHELLGGDSPSARESLSAFGKACVEFMPTPTPPPVP